jgi:hypothetical protein
MALQCFATMVELVAALVEFISGAALQLAVTIRNATLVLWRCCSSQRDTIRAHNAALLQVITQRWCYGAV